MQIHTLSAYETTAQSFFGKLAEWDADLVLDVRLKNTNQLAGFTKRDDLAFFVEKIQHADYAHDVTFSPATTVLERYLRGSMDWEDFFVSYHREMVKRDAVEQFFERYGKYRSVAIVGTATQKRRSHVEILQQMIEDAEAGLPDTALEQVTKRDEAEDAERAAAKEAARHHRKSA